MRKPSLTLPLLMLALPIPVVMALSTVIMFSSMKDSYPPVLVSDGKTVTLHTHDTISLSTMGDTTCTVTGPNGYKAQVRHASAGKFGTDTFVTGERGKYHITCGPHSYVTIDDSDGHLAAEEAGRSSNASTKIVGYLAAFTMAAGLVILILRMRQRKKMSQAEAQVQATD